MYILSKKYFKHFIVNLYDCCDIYFILMIIGVGIDAVSISRIRKILDKRGDKFLKRFFSSSETEYCLKKRDPVPSLSANFAAKEAFLKSLGRGIGQGIALRDISVERDTGGKPRIILLNHERVSIDEEKVHVSITHEADIAIAVVIIEN